MMSTKRAYWIVFIVLSLAGSYVKTSAAEELTKRRPSTMAELSQIKAEGVTAVEVSDYVYGGYQGTFESPPGSDLNPRRAFIILWRDFPFRFVFSHEGSYCPWFELPSGAAASYQFFEGNEGWAELFNKWGRQERNSFVDVIESGPDRVWVRWTYLGLNIESGEAGYRAVEDFWAFPNGLILRRQTYESLKPGQAVGYAREPIELIGLAPAGKFWFDVLKKDPTSGENHALAVLDVFSERRYDVFWKHKPGTLWDSDHRRSGAPWKELDDSEGVVLALPLREGTPFCVFGDASGFGHEWTRIKEHSNKDTGGIGWVSKCWNHWPIGWLNSQGHEVDQQTANVYPNHFSPAGMDFFALSNQQSERGVYYSLLGVGTADLQVIRSVAHAWLSRSKGPVSNPATVAGLGSTSRSP